MSRGPSNSAEHVERVISILQLNLYAYHRFELRAMKSFSLKDMSGYLLQIATHCSCNGPRLISSNSLLGGVRPSLATKASRAFQVLPNGSTGIAPDDTPGKRTFGSPERHSLPEISIANSSAVTHACATHNVCAITTPSPRLIEDPSDSAYVPRPRNETTARPSSSVVGQDLVHNKARFVWTCAEINI